MKRYISDLHFGSEECINRFDKRQFDNVFEMDKYMIKQWNNTIKSGDIVIILGDLFSTKDATRINKILNQLYGKFALIEGNHDREWMKLEGVNLDKFEYIKPYAEIHDAGRSVILSHYPIFFYNHQHQKNSSGQTESFMLYGHVHNSEEAVLTEKLQNIVRETNTTDKHDVTGPIPSQMINCFCMRSDYRPLTLNEWIELEKQHSNWPY